MVDYTPRLKLPRLDLAGGEIANGYPQVQNDLANLVDANAGAKVCTSTTRPATPYQGQIIYETDTLSVYFYNGTAWWPLVPSSAVVCTATMNFAESIGSLFWWDVGGSTGGIKWAIEAKRERYGITFEPALRGVKVNMPTALNNSLWRLTARVALAGSNGGRLGVVCSVNQGQRYSGGITPSGNVNETGNEAVAITNLNNGDIVGVQIYQDTGSAKNIAYGAGYNTPYITLEFLSN